MSDLLTAAAAALGIPEALAQRSAEARAGETGASIDEILTAWAGGAPAPAAATSTAASEQPAPAPETAEVDTAAPVFEVAMPSAPAAAPAAPTGPYEPPTLVGVRDRPLVVLAAAIGLFLTVALIGLVGPASLAEEPGARSSEIAYSATALDGQEIYSSQGCGSCHTQMVRPVVADVGLGGVTLNDSNQILGTRRFGPDLSDVGTRLTGGQIEAILGGFGGHPAHSLSTSDLDRLISYLAQSKTSRAQS